MRWWIVMLVCCARLGGSEACPAGQFQPPGASGNASCVRCPVGQYQNKSGASACLACSVCPSGSYRIRGCHDGLSDGVCSRCSVCAGPVVRPCGPLSDAVCGKLAGCPVLAPPALAWWMLDGSVAGFKCPRAGYYLARFAPDNPSSKVCLPCPDGTVGLDGVRCVACPARQAALADHASCACLPPGVLNATGGCECPDGLLPTSSGCQSCPANSYGAGGACWPCPAGMYSNASATSCAACPVGSYRADGQRLCTACGRGRFPVNASDPGSCVACVAAGACGAGMQESACPVDAALVRCEPCAPLPVGAAWVGSGCEYRCPAGTYHAGGACVACTVTACPPGSVLAACTSFEDGNCDQACTNATMPAQNAVWTDGCGWSCAVGFVPSLQDYWMFQYYVCWPV